MSGTGESPSKEKVRSSRVGTWLMNLGTGKKDSVGHINQGVPSDPIATPAFFFPILK